ncbi:MAG: hypothetical protein M1820_005901 [Bogoriella megaspora]|nr:MAG: hypothetical protein M1820_005901 [Bogoriella megaspora]
MGENDSLEEDPLEAGREGDDAGSYTRNEVDLHPTAFLPPCPPKAFDGKASIVLIGLRGSGKSSLAVMVSTICNLRLVETDRYFVKTIGHSISEHRKSFGDEILKNAHLKVFQSILVACRTGCVVVCSPLLSMDHRARALLQEYTLTNPVIHIARDALSLSRCIPGRDIVKMEKFLAASSPIMRDCSNFTFYNLTEDISTDGEVTEGSIKTRRLATGQMSPRTPFLTLKRVEREFLKFLGHVTGGALTTTFRESTYPLTGIALGSKSFTYAVRVSLEDVLSKRYDVEDSETGSDAFEISIDDVSRFTGDPETRKSAVPVDGIAQALTIVCRDALVPVIFHVPFSEHNAQFNNEAIRRQYCGLVMECLRCASDYVTVDLLLDDDELFELNKVKAHTKLIGHFTFTSRPPRGWDNPSCLRLFERTCNLNLDACRISMPAETFDDNFACRNFRRSANALHPEHLLIAYNTGPVGRISLCLNEILTPVRPESIELQDTPLFPALTARECTNSLYASFVMDPMNFFIIGAAIEYSLSPAMHNAAYRCCGMPHRFMLRQTNSPGILEEMTKDPCFGGTAVNPPFKTEVIGLTQSLSPHAKAIGAVNTLIPVRQSSSSEEQPGNLSLLQERNHAGPVRFLHGDNTDWIGIRTCIRRGLSPINAVGSKTTSLVIGAGGMARATIYAMIQLGVTNIFVCNRSVTNAEKLASHYNSQALPSTAISHAGSVEGQQESGSVVRVIKHVEDAWPSNFQQPTIVVSCIPAHDIRENPAANFTLPTQWFQSPTGGVVVEMAYKPLVTPLLKQIAAEAHRGWITVDGLELLPEQAFAQFELFTGRRAPRKLMKAEALRNYWDAQNQEPGHS